MVKGLIKKFSDNYNLVKIDFITGYEVAKERNRLARRTGDDLYKRMQDVRDWSIKENSILGEEVSLSQKAPCFLGWVMGAYIPRPLLGFEKEHFNEDVELAKEFF